MKTVTDPEGRGLGRARSYEPVHIFGQTAGSPFVAPAATTFITAKPGFRGHETFHETLTRTICRARPVTAGRHSVSGEVISVIEA